MAQEVNACVYCHQGGDPETGYRRTCPGCGRSYLARFPRDEQQQRESGASPATPAMSGESAHSQAQLATETSNVPDIGHSPVQGSLF